MRRSQSIQSIDAICPSNSHQNSRKHLVDLAVQFVGLIDSKVGMEKDTTSQQGTHHGHHNRKANLSVRGCEMGLFVQILVLENRVEPSQRQHEPKTGQHSVDLGIGVSPQFLGNRGNTHRSGHS